MYIFLINLHKIHKAENEFVMFLHGKFTMIFKYPCQ